LDQAGIDEQIKLWHFLSKNAITNSFYKHPKNETTLTGVTTLVNAQLLEAWGG
jgi:hypothetical protein